MKGDKGAAVTASFFICIQASKALGNMSAEADGARPGERLSATRFLGFHFPWTGATCRGEFYGVLVELQCSVF